MAYSTLATIGDKIDLKLLIQLLNDEGRAESAIDLNNAADECAKRFSKAAKEAKEEIDPYLRGKYTLPLATIPDRVLQLSDDITIYNCYKRRNRENMPESILSIYKANIKTLEQIQQGRIDLGIEGTQNTGLSSEIRVNKTSADRIFNNDMWNKY